MVNLEIPLVDQVKIPSLPSFSGEMFEFLSLIVDYFAPLLYVYADSFMYL